MRGRRPLRGGVWGERLRGGVWGHSPGPAGRSWQDPRGPRLAGLTGPRLALSVISSTPAPLCVSPPCGPRGVKGDQTQAGEGRAAATVRGERRQL